MPRLAVRRTAAAKFTPEPLHQDNGRGREMTKIFHGGKRRKIRYEKVAGVYWQPGRRTGYAAPDRHCSDSVSQEQK
jgi:hypothetical protein